MDSLRDRVLALKINPCGKVHELFGQPLHVEVMELQQKKVYLELQFESKSKLTVAEQTIIWSLVPSDVILGIWPWSLVMSCSYPALRSPSASSRIKNLHCFKDIWFVEIRSSSRPKNTKTLASH